VRILLHLRQGRPDLARRALEAVPRRPKTMAWLVPEAYILGEGGRLARTKARALLDEALALRRPHAPHDVLRLRALVEDDPQARKALLVQLRRRYPTSAHALVLHAGALGAGDLDRSDLAAAFARDPLEVRLNLAKSSSPALLEPNLERLAPLPQPFAVDLDPIGAWALERRVARVSPPARAELRRALLAAAQGARWSEVLSRLGAATKQAPRDGPLLVEGARLAVARATPSAAERAIRLARAQDLRPLDRLRLDLTEAELCQRTRRRERADELLLRVEAEAPDGVEKRLAAALRELPAALGGPRAKHALVARLAELLDRYPFCVEAWRLLGELLCTTHPRSGLFAFDQVLALEGATNLRTLVSRATVHSDLCATTSQPEARARDEWDRSLAVEPDELRLLLGAVYWGAQHDYDPGWVTARLERAKELAPGTFQVLLAEGLWELELGEDAEAALAAWEAALRKRPGSSLDPGLAERFRQVFGDHPRLAALAGQR
jgi:hypothetical protein